MAFPEQSLGPDWTDLNDAQSLSDGTTYQVQNLGMFDIYLNQSAAEPGDGLSGARIVPDGYAELDADDAEHHWARAPQGGLLVILEA